MKPSEIFIKDFKYTLSSDRIAHFSLAERDKSKLLVYKNGEITSSHFTDLSNQLPENSNLLLNNTRVIEARLLFKKPTGGIIEIFCLEPTGNLQHTEEALNTPG